MISELFFARERGGFWHELLPMEEKFVRELNMLGTKQFSRRARGLVPRSDRDFVNELAFRIFEATSAQKNILATRSLDRAELRIVLDETYAYIERLRSKP